MRILVSNDDGIFAPGIYELAKAMMVLGEVVVVAPDGQRSASSHGISLHQPIYAEQVDIGLHGVEAWSLTGTPVDCVKWGAVMLGQHRPFDLMAAGVNEGANMATDVLYSGTVAAAGEAALQGIPGAAFSIVGPPYPYPEAAATAVEIMEKLITIGLPPDTFLNVNFPATGIRNARWCITQLGARSYKSEFVLVTDANGRPCYRHAGEALRETKGDDADIKALHRNEVSITPLSYRFTNYEMLDSLKTWITSAENRVDG